MKKLLIPAICMFLSFITVNLQGQSVQLLSVDASKYPYITAGFKLYDAQGNEIRTIQKNDVIVNETTTSGLILREVIEVEAPSLTLGTNSVVFSIDISQSMSDALPGGLTKIDGTKEGLKEWAKIQDPKRTETAITAFCGDAVASVNNSNEPPCTLTNDKDVLFAAIDGMPPPCTGTNYNAAFLYKRFDIFYKQYSALYWCKPDKVKYKPVIIFLTDGNHLPEFGGPINGGRFNIDEVQRLSALYNVTIYVIQLGTEPITPDNQTHLQNLSFIGKPTNDITPNIWMGVNDLSPLINILLQIYTEIGTYGTPPPCFVTWKADCQSGTTVISFPNYGGISDTISYTINPSLLPDLEISPEVLAFNNTKLNQTTKADVTLTAKKNFVELSNIEFTEDLYGSDRIQIDWGLAGPPPIILDKDSSYTIGVQYTALDANQTSAKIKIKGSSCYDDIVTITASPVTDVEELTESNDDGIKISPNPADDYFELIFPNDVVGNIKISIYDLMGNEIINVDFNNVKSKVHFNTASLSSGYYFVVCTAGKMRKFKPLIVEH